jgi:adenylylsulfate kinase-like enzyme
MCNGTGIDFIRFGLSKALTFSEKTREQRIQDIGG